MQNRAIVVGPTCTGKTSLAVKLCKQFDGVILSADSRQVVKYMDVGTGKVPVSGSGVQLAREKDRWVLDGVDVFGYDLINPDDYFSAFDFKSYCEKLFPQVSRNGKNVFLVGGTGFYIDAVTGRTSLEGVSPDMALRHELKHLSVEELAGRLLKLDEVGYNKVDAKNPARLIRAIEKASHMRSSLASDRRSDGISKASYIGLTASREVLYSRADRWVEEIFGEKLFEEVRLLQKLFPKSHRLTGLVYKSTLDYLSGVSTLEEARQRAKFDVHAYIRRQQTWFKRDPEIRWFDISQPNFDAEVSFLVESILNEHR